MSEIWGGWDTFCYSEALYTLFSVNYMNKELVFDKPEIYNKITGTAIHCTLSIQPTCHDAFTQ